MSVKISIITPVLNQAAFVEQAIQSVLLQHDLNFEHIVVDGGSTDGTLDIIKSHPHLRWISEPDRGQADAVNKGLAMATGEMIGEINGDDFYLPGAFAKLRVAMKTYRKAQVFIGGCDFFEDGELIDVWQPAGAEVGLADVLEQLRKPLPHPSLFVAKELFRAVGGMDATLRYSPDVELMFKLAERTTFTVIASSLAVNLKHPDAIQVKEEIHNWTGVLYQTARHGPYAKFHEMFLHARSCAPDPVLPAFIAAYVKERWKNLPHAAEPVRKAALFGAGRHSRWLEELTAGLAGPEIVAILDENPDACGQDLWGLKPIHPTEWNPAAADAVIISTDAHLDAMRRKCGQLFGGAVRALSLYEGLPEGPYRK